MTNLLALIIETLIAFLSLLGPAPEVPVQVVPAPVAVVESVPDFAPGCDAGGCVGAPTMENPNA